MLAVHAHLQSDCRESALRTLERLRDHAMPLVQSAQVWPAVASLLAQIAPLIRSEHVIGPVLEETRVALSERRSDALAVHGVAYFGSVELALATLADRATSCEAQQAIDAEVRRGATWWADRARDLAGRHGTGSTDGLGAPAQHD